jgi:hypothetical protein
VHLFELAVNVSRAPTYAPPMHSQGHTGWGSVRPLALRAITSNLVGLFVEGFFPDFQPGGSLPSVVQPLDRAGCAGSVARVARRRMLARWVYKPSVGSYCRSIVPDSEPR